MKRRLFAKNLAALLAIPFVNIDEDFLKVKKEEEWVEIKEIEQIAFGKEVEQIAFPGANTMLLQIKDKCTKIQLSKILLWNSRTEQECITEWESLYKSYDKRIYDKIESQVEFSGIIIENNIRDYFQNKVNFTVFLEQDHYLEGVGEITEMSIDNKINVNSIITFCINIRGGVNGTYKGEMLPG